MTGRRDGGMATAELAVVLPALVLVVAAALTAVSVLLAQLRCVDAAREGARAAARGEPAEVARSAAARAAPTAAAVQIGTEGDSVRVTVSATAGRGGGLLPAFRVSGTAVALREPESAGVP
ncbi:MAG TPA: TadE family type IV pilus minor pilin [Mycobacteriales bacterium]|nr:TadE family type IV pilus minor pilin [Mycobacteriales bacterium]